MFVTDTDTPLTSRSNKVHEDDMPPNLQLRRERQRLQQLQQLRQLRELSMQAVLHKQQSLARQATRQLEEAITAQIQIRQEVQRARVALQQDLQSRSFTRLELVKYTCEVEHLQDRVIDATSTVSNCRHHSHRANEALAHSRDALRQLSHARQKIDCLLDALTENMP